jgi:hypothetical protein
MLVMGNRTRFSSSFCLLLLFCIPNLLTWGNSFSIIYHSGYELSNENIAASSTLASSTKEIVVGSSNCPVWGYCDEDPSLTFNFSDQLEVDEGYLLHVLVEGKHYEFTSIPAEIKLSRTVDRGVAVEYWAESTSTGSVFSVDDFRMRYVEENGQNLLQLLGEQWQDEIPGSALIWNVFPPMSEFENGWAQRVTNPDDLETSIEYTLLAGRLIWDGIVVARDCPDNGLLENGAANTCGMEAARSKVIEWQNNHNDDIQEASLEAFIPARLLKGMIGQESQFYSKWELENEYGLGMLTEHGTDMLLQWNEAYFMEQCSLLYGKSYCSQGYLNLSDDQKALLIGYVMQVIGTDEEYELLAETLRASCYQTYYIVSYYTEYEPYEVADYDTLWRIALGVYHAGFGCMANAVALAWNLDDDSLIWEEVAGYLGGDCSSAINYFDKVVNFGE